MIPTAKSNIAERAEALCGAVIEREGFETVEVKLENEYGSKALVFYIYSPDGVSINDCERIHNLIEPILDENDVSDGKAYYLSVSSMGLDRPIRTTKDFLRLKGKEIDVKLYAARDGKKTFTGIIADCTDTEAFLETADGTVSFLRKDIASAKQTV